VLPVVGGGMLSGPSGGPRRHRGPRQERLRV